MFGRLVQGKEAFPNSHRLFSGLLATGVLHDYVPSAWDIRRLPQSWSPSSWRAWPVHQIPVYPDPAKFFEIERRLGGRPQLVSPAKVRRLKEYLAEAEEGRAFVLQGGDCAERFSDCGTDSARDTFRLLQRMAVVLADAAAVPVVKIGRMAGQFAKPRSTDREVRGDVILPCY